MINPFFVYLISFFGVLATYTLGWSKVYPNLSLSLLGFLVVSFVLSGLLGIKHYKENGNKFNVINYKKEYSYGIIFIVIGYLAEYIYTAGMPLTNPGINYHYYKGIPTLHVILYTFTIFYSVFLFYLYICTKKLRLIGLFIITLIPSVLLISRGMMVNIFVGCFFVGIQYIISNKVLSRKVIIGTVVTILAVFYVFGLFGNYRSNKNRADVSNKFNSNYILSIGAATDGFKKSFLPKSFFWSYLYISSPLANLQKNINELNPEISFNNLRKFMIVEIIPDFIAKRLSPTFEEDSKKIVKLIKPELTVGTMYMGAFCYLGWLGIVMIYVYMTLFSSLFLRLLKNNETYYVVGLSLLCNIIVLNTFDNMLSYSGMMFQLAYPLIIPYLGIFLRNFNKRRYCMKKIISKFK